ncbi:MAG TPA: pyridoxamine 5'-phosphate oxidase family protein, partial [Verrucomicrobiae bacterium]|nr:pyridoxamine 5'-phosphate oxidase family protein [Verrucomicrobiae bacterium]
APMLTDDMRAVIESAHLCFAATISADGRPNLSPKGTIRVLDEGHLFFLDIASPRTRANVLARRWMEINVVEQLSRRGYRFAGPASVHVDDEIYRGARSRVLGEEGVEFPVASVIVLAVERAEPIVSPGYDHVETEGEMRASWRARRAALDREFEGYLSRRARPGST